MSDCVGASGIPVRRPQQQQPGTTPLVCLNFKVPLRIRQQFKQYAARNNITMTELLLKLVNQCLEVEVSPDGTQQSSLSSQCANRSRGEAGTVTVEHG